VPLNSESRSAALWRYAAAAVLTLTLASAVGLAAEPAIPPDDLDSLRREAVAAARDALQHEQALAALQSDISLRERERAGRQRGLDESRVEQADFLAVLLSIARDPANRVAVAPAAPL
jgi:hypothetical protein